MTLTPTHLTALRAYLKEFTASSIDETHQSQADTVNALLPALIDTITDEDLTQLSHTIWGMVISQITMAPTQKPEEDVPQSPPASPSPITLTDL